MVIDHQMTFYRGCTPVVDCRFDRRSKDSLTAAIVRAIAEAEHIDPTEVSPLYDAVDLDALSELFDRFTDKAGSQSIYGFCVDHWNVFIQSDGCVRVCDGSKPTGPEPVFEGFCG